VFKDNFKSVKEIFNLVILDYRNVLRIKWKNDVLSQPFFCNVKNTTGGVHILSDKAFLYAKYRDIFVRLGCITGFKIVLELY